MFRRLNQGPDADCTIITAAGKAPNYENVLMSKVMKDYILSLFPSAKVVALQGETFNTDGEVRALAGFVKAMGSDTEIIICGKWWHLPRTRLLLDVRLKERGMDMVWVSQRHCRSVATWMDIMKELVKLLITTLWYPYKILLISFTRHGKKSIA